jgi:hypothetical protein
LLWAYQFVAQLNLVRESWTALVDVERVGPTQDANEVAARQIEALLGPLEEGGGVPLFVFDAGYDPVPSLCEPPEHIGRPRRHGPKMKCSDPSRPGPSPPQNTTARVPLTVPCAYERGPGCTRRSTTTQEGALEDPCR